MRSHFLLIGTLRRLLFPALLALSIASAPGAGQAEAQNLSLKDIHYSSPPDASRTMDLYVPPAGDKTVPLVLWIHGGGWIMGDKSDAPANDFLGRGYALATINYRFATQARFPAQLDDCLQAVQWLKDHAAQYHLDVNSLAVIGESSGGQLAALLGTIPNAPAKAVVTLAAPTDLTTLAAQAQTPGQKFLAADGGQVALLLGAPARKVPELAMNASPVKYVSARSAPFLVVQGSADTIVPVQQSAEFDERLRAAGGRSQLLIVPGAAHSIPTPSWEPQAFAFLSQNLANQAAAPQRPARNRQDWQNIQQMRANRFGRESPHDRRARRRAERAMQDGNSWPPGSVIQNTVTNQNTNPGLDTAVTEPADQSTDSGASQPSPDQRDPYRLKRSQ